jgi:hypothetical protein
MFDRLCAGFIREARQTRSRRSIKPVVSEPLMIRGRPPPSTAVALLQAQGLPVSDITEAHLQHFSLVFARRAPRS